MPEKLRKLNDSEIYENFTKQIRDDIEWQIIIYVSTLVAPVIPNGAENYFSKKNNDSFDITFDSICIVR